MILLMGVTTFLFAQTIAPKKCCTCGKLLAQCQYKGRHPIEKKCTICSQKISQCFYKGNHPVTRGTHNGHDWVDLGLSVRWATCNIGSSSPSDHGSYFAWGEITPKTYFSRTNYKFTNRNPNQLPLENDAAHVIWGGRWRMPTAEEVKELHDSKISSQSDSIGLTLEGPNGETIFFPTTGSYWDTTLRYKELGSYWTATWASDEYQRAHEFSCCGFIGSNVSLGGETPYTGLCIRPVMDY